MRLLRWLIVPVVVIPVVLLLAAGFGRDPRAIPAALLGKPVPAFRLVTVDGQTITNSDLRGTPTLINFWASWCGPCVDEHQVLQDAVTRYGSRVRVLGVLYQDNADGARRFEARFGQPTWPSLLDPSGALALDFGVTGPPESYLVDASGIVRDKVFGPLTTSVLEMKLQGLLSR